MKFSAAILTAAIVPSAFASPLLFDASFGPSEPLTEVPGDNPFKYCSGSKLADHLLNLTQVDLSPLPPMAGQLLSIQASGTVKETILKGAYVDVAVKYGLIKIASFHFDLCDQVKNVGLKCPIEAGEVVISKDVELPKEIPPGQYTVSADARTVDDELLTCLTGNVQFSLSHLDL